MVEAGKNLRFSLEPRQTIRIAGKRLGQDLQRLLPIQLCIGGLIDLSHPAFTDEGGDVVVAESGTDGEGHGLSGLDRGHSTYGGSVAPAAAQKCPENANVCV